MKKIYTIALTLLAGAALVSCEPEQLVQIDPGQTVAPVLKTFEGATLDADELILSSTTKEHSSVLPLL